MTSWANYQKQRYHEDEEYRKRWLERNMKYYVKNKEKLKAKMRERYAKLKEQTNGQN
jgi:hypothetical protein